MRQRSFIPAALFSAGVLLAICPPVQARTVRKTRAGAVSAAAKTTAHPGALQRASASRNSSTKSRSGTHRARRTAETAVAEVYGPFLPAEAYDYPRPECSEFDAVIEVREHGTEGEEAPDVDVAEEEGVGVPPAPNPLTVAARKLGSLLRPKSAATAIRPEDVDLSDILTAGVQIPVEGVDASRLKDSFLNSRGQHRKHLAIDIGAPKGTPVLAASDGEVITLRKEKRGGISLYQKDPSGRYLLYYCHLTRYAAGLREGRKVHKGDVIAYVGRTGHVIGGAHLHFSITRLAQDDDNFKAGMAINPYLLFLAAVP